MGKIFAVGDIHGSYKALVQCLERSGFNKETDTLIQLGDVADGWSEVYQCVEELLTIPNLISIRGNHDFWTLQWMMTGIMMPTHREQGGQATMDSYKDHSVVGHVDFFKRQLDYYVDEKNRLYTHGGFNRWERFEEGPVIHNFNWDRTLWKQALSCKNDVKLVTVENLDKIFIGHTTTLNWGTDKPMYSGGVWNLDTGAGFNGRLTIMDVESEAYWQSDLVQDLYSNEEGRYKKQQDKGGWHR